MSNLPSHIAGTTLPLPRPHSPSNFHPSASTPTFLEPSTFHERPHTISYPREHSNARPVLTAMTFEPLNNTKSQNASNHSLPSNMGNYAAPGNVTVTMRLPKTAEDGEMVADIYARPLQGQRRSGVAPCPVAPPTVPEKYYTLQMQQNNTGEENEHLISLSMPFALSVSLSLCLSIYMYVCISVCLTTCLSHSVSLCVCLSVSLYVEIMILCGLNNSEDLHSLLTFCQVHCLIFEFVLWSFSAGLVCSCRLSSAHLR